jgi:hypothetical protein
MASGAEAAEGGVGDIHQALPQGAIAHNLADTVELAEVFHSNSNVIHGSLNNIRKCLFATAEIKNTRNQYD